MQLLVFPVGNMSRLSTTATSLPGTWKIVVMNSLGNRPEFTINSSSNYQREVWRVEEDGEPEVEWPGWTILDRFQDRRTLALAAQWSIIALAWTPILPKGFLPWLVSCSPQISIRILMLLSFIWSSMRDQICISIHLEKCQP